MTRRLRSAGVQVRPRAEYPALVIMNALLRDISQLRGRKIEEEVLLLELERRQKEADLVPMDAALEVITRTLLPVRQRLMALPSEMSARCNPTDPVHSEKALDDWLQRSLAVIQSAIGKTAAPAKPRKRKAAR
ncbi:MAG: hypothetical protein H7A47_01030 [Verrucomicrobiales bacterium]|nr:hypothetical protein [Verrucomicrobiales bacterium]